MSEYVAALDGGGTKTVGAVADKDGNVQFMSIEAGCNPFDNNAWADGLLASIAHLQNSPYHICQATFGLPGYGESKKFDLESNKIVNTNQFAGNTCILNDVEMAFYGAFTGDEGVLLLAGTGSMSIAQGAKGHARVGGWGDAFGDEGSAYWMGRRALSLASKALDGRLQTPEFVNGLHDFLKLNLADNPQVLLEWVATQKHLRSAIAAIAFHVDYMAQQGNRTALQIIDDAAAELTNLAATAARRSGLSGAPKWAYAGSVFKSQLLTLAVSKGLGQKPVVARLSALGGGLLRAAIDANWAPDEKWIHNVAIATRG